jgi:hypothetical protein
MAKRFTDTEKWKKRFIRDLSKDYKLLWLYILDDCDHAGIWHIDLDVANIRLGVNTTIKEMKIAFSDKIIFFDGDEKIFIPNFIEFQYGTLNPKNRVHASIIQKLEKYKISPLQAPYDGAYNGAKDKDKDKDKDKEKEKDKDEDKEIFEKLLSQPNLIKHLKKLKQGGRLKILPPPNLDEWLQFFTQKGYSVEMCGAEEAFHRYDADNWHNANGEIITNWQKTATNYFRPEFKIKQEQPQRLSYSITEKIPKNGS